MARAKPRSKPVSEDEEMTRDEDVPMNDAETESSVASEEEEQADDEDDEDTTQPINKRQRRTEINNERRKHFGRQKEDLQSAKYSDSAKRFAYLIGLTDLFRHFIGLNPELAKAVEQADVINKNKKKGRNSSAATGSRTRRTEKEEDAELLEDEINADDSEQRTIFSESPNYIQGQMRDYQVAGLNWLISLHENGISGILADEMGLGKTLQTISFVGYLRFIQDIKGPHLVIVPKSTLDNWKREFARWIPEIHTLVLQGAKDERQELINQRLLPQDFDVCITSYEMVMREKHHLKKFAWKYIIVDEAHRIKNEESSLSKIVRMFESRGRLLITGTPLQNNLHELWALLNFLLPDVFSSSEAFDEWFESSGHDQDTVVLQLHKVLRPFLLRRVKADVEKSLLPKKECNLYVGMSDMQIKQYRNILEKDIDALNGQNMGKRESKTRLLNIVMQLRKCCNHPYLFDGAEPGPPYTTDEHLVFNSGKMVVLDKLLKRMQEKGSRVLIFSQMSRVLDILEDYCMFREFKYNRIDGSTAHEDRISAIDEYNKPGSEKFIFLLTTRAGGLGINLTTADIVVLYDSDWNPQADLQAMDRAHRIGQTKQVHVYRFITENAIEEKIIERAAQKLRLDQLVIQQGRAQPAAKAASSGEDLLGIIQHGAQQIMDKATAKEGTQGTIDDDEDIDAYINKGSEKTEKMKAKFSTMGLEDVQRFNSDSAYEWNGQDFQKRETRLNFNWINPAKRERKEQVYSVDKYYSTILNPKVPKGEQKPRAPRPPTQIRIQDHQFYPHRLVQLQEQETAYYRKTIGYKIPGVESDDDLRKDDRELEQMEIDNAVPLTVEEIAEKERLAEQGFYDWSRRDYQQFVNLSARYGRKALDSIAAEMDKEPKQVKAYAKVFWERYTEIDGYDRAIQTIVAGEERSEKTRKQQENLRTKIEQYRVPLQQMKINYSVSTTNKKIYTEDEDRFLLVQLDKYGLESENLYEYIQNDIRDCPLFRFDWFFLSRTPAELSRRCQTLLTTVDREFDPKSKVLEDEEEPKPGKKGTKGSGKTSRQRSVEDDDETGPPAKKGKTTNGVTANGKGPKNKNIDQVKTGAGSKAASNTTSRATSVGSNSDVGGSSKPGPKPKGKANGTASKASTPISASKSKGKKRT
ncbi:hypothetical protein TWF225_010872 [Orbilia oligospora]|nr:hypothetical protein TWF225_010872 [Orbilia oligospora]KAF3252538.1 hypothetical protein TWF217_007732 [Orbilia oligospora]KAF3271470.1 hypothetical protein TWF128_000062 [Orbilia oligospora]